MQIERKRGVRGFRIVSHNKKVFYVIIVLVILLVALMIAPKYLPKTMGKNNETCYSNSDCVPTSCCHASSCILESKKPNCTGIYCTMDCKPDTLDCGQASCECLKGKCEVNFNPA
jgi:hypothetical protein